MHRLSVLESPIKLEACMWCYISVRNITDWFLKQKKTTKKPSEPVKKHERNKTRDCFPPGKMRDRVSIVLAKSPHDGTKGNDWSSQQTFQFRPSYSTQFNCELKGIREVIQQTRVMWDFQLNESPCKWDFDKCGEMARPFIER